MNREGQGIGLRRKHGIQDRFIAAVMAVLAITMSVSACGDGGTEPPPSGPPRATTLTVSPATVQVAALGATVQLTVEVRDQNGHVMTSAGVTWSSSDPSVATVDGSGLVTAAGNGTTAVAATSGSASASAAVTVAQTVSVVTVSPSADTLVAFGDTTRLLAEAMDANGHVVPGTEFVWVSSNTEVALVDGSGLVTAAAAGGATVTATSVSVSGTAAVTVVENPDREALVALYEATDGPNWFNSDNWLADTPLGNWYGVNTDDLGRVVGLSLSSNGLNGELPTELWALTKLRTLDLSESPELRGRIPSQLGNLTDLTRLSIWLNQLTGEIPPELGRLTQLTTVILSAGELAGPIPPQLGNLAKLDTLVLGGALTGVIPSELGELGNLTRLGLWGDLTGQIPAELGRLANLESLNLQGNSLVGSIPAELGDLATLTDLRLNDNALSGGIPKELAGLSELKGLFLNNNELTGEIPHALASLPRLQSLHLNQNRLTGPIPARFRGLTELIGLFFTGNAGLCAPGTSEFVAWLSAIASQGPYCNETDADALSQLYQRTGGPNWTSTTGWLSTPALDEWYGVSADSLGRVLTLDLTSNGLAGPLPHAFGSLSEMTRLRISGNALTGRLPLGLARLTLTELDYSETGLCAPADEAFRAWLDAIPVYKGTEECPSLTGRDILTMLYEATDGPNWVNDDNWLTDAPLGDWYGVSANDPDRITILELSNNGLTGEIRPELGSLVDLVLLDLGSNQLTGEIPAELGNLNQLQSLDLQGNRLSGEIPRELGNLTRLGILDLRNNGLRGEIPPELGNLTGLVRLWVSWNRALHGPLPESLTGLRWLERFRADGTGLCVPTDRAFQAWLVTIQDHRIQPCQSQTAYLTQAVQSLGFPVPLVAGERALLRVFVTTQTGTSARVPLVRARFYLGGREVHSRDIPGTSEVIPTRPDESELAKSSNAEIPGSVIRPGLEMVIEVDPDETLEPTTGLVRRIPEMGRVAVDVRAVPGLDLTLIPLVYNDTGSSFADSVVDLVSRMATDPETNEELRQIRTLLPVGKMDVKAHDIVAVTEATGRGVHSSINFYNAVQVVRTLEGGTGYYMGVTHEGSGGLASLGGRVSWAGLKSAAHELGHNMSLRHVPYSTAAPRSCGYTDNVDPHYPYGYNIGAWGYDAKERKLVPPTVPDVMSYCDNVWIGDYHFTKALRYRLATEADAAPSPRPVTSLLLWGGTDSDGRPFLEPAFIVDAPPALPESVGEYEIVGSSANGAQLFALRFAMPELADRAGGAGFVFALPVRAGWERNLASITLTSPGGSFTLNRDSDLPAAILRDSQSGQVRGILRVSAASVLSQANVGGTALGAGLEILFSRGIPGPGAELSRAIGPSSGLPR